jgi:hypothetical protein
VLQQQPGKCALALRGQASASLERRALYRELHALLAGVRERSVDRLHRLDTDASAARANLDQARIAADQIVGSNAEDGIAEYLARALGA